MEPLHNAYEYLYQKEGEAPWTFKEPPKELIVLLENGHVKPCKVLDIGCGEGYISVYLASKGFDVTGIDISSNAVKLAEKHAKENNVRCNFMQLDWKDLPRLKEKFNFILDWRFFHEVTDEKEREKYVNIVSSLLGDNGRYLSVAFSGQFKQWGTGKLRKSPTGITLFLPHGEELERLFGRKFEILEKKIIKVPQREIRGGVTSYFFFMQKK